MTENFPIIPAPAKAFWSLGIGILLMVLMLCLFLYITYSALHVQVELADQTLRIRGDLYGRRIPISSLVVSEAKIINLQQKSPLQARWRTNGIGLPGYSSGWFRLKNGEKALLWVTDPHQVVYLPTKEGYVLMMSVKEPERFLQSLRRNIGTEEEY